MDNYSAIAALLEFMVKSHGIWKPTAGLCAVVLSWRLPDILNAIAALTR